MSPDLAPSIVTLARNVQDLSSIISKQAFWDTQWFAALIGAIAALVVTSLKEYMVNRRDRLEKFYDWVMRQNVFFSPDSLIRQAGSTSYGGTMTRDGVTTEIPEKPMTEKIVIELRRHAKYWRFPISLIRFHFWRYEEALRKMPNDISRVEMKTNEKYKAAEVEFNKICRLAEKKTGDTQWTHSESI